MTSLQKKKTDKEIIFTLSAGLFSVFLAALICFCQKDEVLGCHDSFYDFVYARMHSFPEWYRNVLDFNLARGRAGFLSSLVTTFRYLILSTGDYTAVWLLQQVPIWVTVFLISWMVGKKTRPCYGFMFAVFFCAFAQIDTNHNLFNCYPFDFMYAMSVSVTGLYLYDSYLEHRGSKRNGLRLALSLLCYYESMTMYEPFIVAGVIYAVILIARLIVMKKEDGSMRFIPGFFKGIIYHLTTAVFFFILLKLLKMSSLSQTVKVTAVDEYGSLHDCLLTWKTFSFSLFPLSAVNVIHPSVCFLTFFAGRLVPMFTVFAACGVLSVFMAARSAAGKNGPEDTRKVRYNLIVLAVCGLLFAVFFTVPHAMTYNYQLWVTELNAGGYLTSSLCYFGWALMFSCIVSALAETVCRKRPAVFIPVSVLIAAAFFTGALFTVNINSVFRGYDSVTGQQMSLRGQAFYSFFASDYAEDYAAELIYIPGYWGIHYEIEIDDEYADHEVGRDVTLTNDIDYYRSQSPYFDYCGELRYDPETDAAFYAGIDNPGDRPDQWVTSGSFALVSSKPGRLVFSYEDPVTGEQITEQIDAQRMEVYQIPNNATVDTDSLTISNK